MKMSDKITSKDLRKVRYRWLLFGEASWNYEKMQGLGYCYSMIPVLKKLYTNKEDMKIALKTHNQFFNCHQEFTEIILGADIAMEEKNGIESMEAVSAVKTGLMGPLAGIGDTLFGVIANTIIFSIGSYMALQGNPLGIWINLIWAAFRIVLRGWFLKTGYREGTKIVTSMGATLNRITEAASVLGLTVVGALIPSVIRANIPLVFEAGEVTMELQSVIDQMMPALIPVLLVVLVYWLLGRKGMSSSKAILIVIAISLVLGGFGILG